MKHYSLISLVTKDRNEYHTRLMSVNSLNSSILVAHASSCSYPNPVTKSDLSTQYRSKQLVFRKEKRKSQSLLKFMRFILITVPRNMKFQNGPHIAARIGEPLQKQSHDLTQKKEKNVEERYNLISNPNSHNLNSTAISC